MNSKDMQKEQADIQKRQEDRADGKIYPNSDGKLFSQPIDPKTDKPMPGFVESQKGRKKCK